MLKEAVSVVVALAALSFSFPSAAIDGIGIDKSARAGEDKDKSERVARTQDYPASAVTYITFKDRDDNEFSCTGFLISPDTVVTAGHCVHEGKGGDWYPVRSYQVFPGKNGKENPNGSCFAKRLYSVVDWTKDGDGESDYGAIKLNCNIGARVGFFGIVDPQKQHKFLNAKAAINGYPNDKPAMTQWTAAGRIEGKKGKEKDLLVYSIDVDNSQAGAPVYIKDGEGCAQKACVMAIHMTEKKDEPLPVDENDDKPETDAARVKGDERDAADRNSSGIAIRADVFRNLNKWKSEP